MLWSALTITFSGVLLTHHRYCVLHQWNMYNAASKRDHLWSLKHAQEPHLQLSIVRDRNPRQIEGLLHSKSVHRCRYCTTTLTISISALASTTDCNLTKPLKLL